MSADGKLRDIHNPHSGFSGVLNLTTNILTPEGRKIACTWIHTTIKRDPFESGISNGHTDTVCMVTGDSLDEVMRKVAEMEADFKENGQ